MTPPHGQGWTEAEYLHEVAGILGLSHSGSVFGYLRRYADLPRPVIDLGRRRIALWLRPEVVAWRDRHPRRSAS